MTTWLKERKNLIDGKTRRNPYAQPLSTDKQNLEYRTYENKNRERTIN